MLKSVIICWVAESAGTKVCGDTGGIAGDKSRDSASTTGWTVATNPVFASFVEMQRLLWLIHVKLLQRLSITFYKDVARVAWASFERRLSPFTR